MRSADGGDTFSAPLTLPGGGQFAPGPDSVLHVSWPQVPASGQYPDVFYSRGDAIAFPAFADVPSTYWAWRWIEALFRARVSGGCGALPPRYCPELPVLRGDMAVFLLRSKEGSQYVPPPATGVFEDIPTSSPIAPWVEELHRRRITGGCGVAPLRYCPGDPVLRSHMAVFLLRTLLGGDYTPPPATGMFQDVAPTDPFAPWIEELARRGVTSGCSASPPLYCPGSPATRAEMAVFLVSTFAIPL
jgi:hypothetical protein